MMKENKRNILIVNTSGLGVGGITTHMLNYIEELRNENFNGIFTIVITGVRDERVLKEFEKLGCKLQYLPDRKKHILKYICSLNILLKNNEFDVIHVHGNSSTMSLELLQAKMFKIPIRIAHCHNSKCEHIKIHKILSLLFKSSMTKAVACSELAGEWIFGVGNYMVLPNAINLKKFQYNSKSREDYRNELKIDRETLLIGHVGNFNEQKNHEFLIDVFCELLKKRRTKLVLIGTGPLEDDIKRKVKDLQIENEVFFKGVREDVNCWMQAMDILVFPSKWEGFGMVLIEGQVSNLPIIVSTEVPRIVAVTDFIRFIDLKSSIQLWCDEIIGLVNDSNREGTMDTRLFEYDIERNAHVLSEIYEGRV